MRALASGFCIFSDTIILGINHYPLKFQFFRNKGIRHELIIKTPNHFNNERIVLFSIHTYTSFLFLKKCKKHKEYYFLQLFYLFLFFPCSTIYLTAYLSIYSHIQLFLFEIKVVLHFYLKYIITIFLCDSVFFYFSTLRGHVVFLLIRYAIAT